MSAEEIISKLDGIVDSLQPLDNKKFIHFEYKDKGKQKESWVYPEPLRKKSLINKRNLFVDFNFPEQIYLYKKMEEEFGIKARHGTLKENFKAAYSPQTKEYKEKVLVNKVYTGEIITREIENSYVRRVLEVNFVDFNPREILFENEKRILTKYQPKYGVEYYLSPRLQKVHQSSTGARCFFDDFNIVPTVKDLKLEKNEERGIMGDIHYDKEGLSSICGQYISYFWGIGESPLSPLYVPIWTDENPKK